LNFGPGRNSEKMVLFLGCEPWENTAKVEVNFFEPAREIGPLKLTKNDRVTHSQRLLYTNFEKLKKATSLDEAF